MYIRRKVYSVAEDDYGYENLYSVNDVYTDYEDEQYYSVTMTEDEARLFSDFCDGYYEALYADAVEQAAVEAVEQAAEKGGKLASIKKVLGSAGEKIKGAYGSAKKYAGEYGGKALEGMKNHKVLTGLGGVGVAGAGAGAAYANASKSTKMSVEGKVNELIGKARGKKLQQYKGKAQQEAAKLLKMYEKNPKAFKGAGIAGLVGVGAAAGAKAYHDSKKKK